MYHDNAIIQIHRQTELEMWIWTIYSLCFSFLRLTFDLNNLYALIIIAMFIWGLVTVCSTLLMIQMEIVEYSVDIKGYCILFSQEFFIFGTGKQSPSIDQTNISRILVVCAALFHLWIRPNIDQPFRWVECCNLRMWLAYIPEKCTKNIASHHSEHSTASCSSNIWKCFLQSWIIQKSEFYF